MSALIQALKGLAPRLQSRPWAEQLDFAGPRVRTAMWSWALLGAGVLALLLVADQGDAQRQAIDEARAQLKRLSKADRQLRIERAAKAGVHSDKAQVAPVASQAASDAAPPPASTLDAQALPEAVAMAAYMAYPWGEVLRDASQRAMDHKVVLLALSLDLAGWDVAAMPAPTARLLAAVPSDEVALRWAADLPEGQLRSRATLQTPFTSLLGSFALKAEVQARWTTGQAGGQP